MNTPSKATQVCVNDRRSLSQRLQAILVLPPLMVMAACQTEPKAVTPEALTEYNKPGIVLVQTNHKVEFTVPKPEFRGDAQITQEVRAKFARKELKSKAEATDYIIKQMLTQPAKYMRPGERLREEAEVPTTGTGFIVAENTVATAAHVVSNKGKEIKRTIARTALKKVTIDWCKGVIEGINKNRNASQSMSNQELMDLCIDGFKDYYAQHLEIDKVETQTSIVMQPAMPGQNTSPQVISSEIKKMGEKIPDADVAILTLSGGENLPILQLGDDSPVAAGQRVLSIGYPGAMNDLRNSKALPEPTLTSGAVSARQDGLIQTDAAVSPGSSGGPLFNDRGEVVGIASFIKVNREGAAVGGGNFFVPVSVLKQFLQESGISPKDSKVTQTYQRAIDLSQAKQYGKALEEFKKVRDISPNFPYVQQKITQTQSNVSDQPFTLPGWAYGAGGALLIGSAAAFGAKRYFATQTPAAHKSEPGSLSMKMPQLLNRVDMTSVSASSPARHSDNN